MAAWVWVALGGWVFGLPVLCVVWGELPRLWRATSWLREPVPADDEAAWW